MITPSEPVEEELISAIRGHEPIRRTSFLDAVNYMDFTEAVHISSREGRRVYLPLGWLDQRASGWRHSDNGEA